MKKTVAMAAILLVTPLNEHSAACAYHHEKEIDAVIQSALDTGQAAGFVVLVGTAREMLFCKAYGHRTRIPSPEPMREDTIFDVASLTKPVVTATAIMQLYQRGLIELDAPLARYLPAFFSHGKDAITIRQLLQHRAGFIPDNPLEDYFLDNKPNKEHALEAIYNLELIYPPGTSYKYTDVGYILLGHLIETITGQALEAYTQKHIFGPLGLNDTCFLSLYDVEGDPRKDRIAPTTLIKNTPDGPEFLAQGVVHDPRARALGGAAGHAGLFSTAQDLARFCQALMQASPRLGLLPDTVTLITTADPSLPVDQLRTLGWDAWTPSPMGMGFSLAKGPFASPESFCHVGFTGTSIAIDPTKDLFLIILSSRLHPVADDITSDIKNNVNNTRIALANVVFQE